MKQVFQDCRTGAMVVEEVPAPVLRAGGVLVRTACSLISPGTERSAIELARKSLVSKAKERPDLVRTVIDKVQRDGVAATVQSVRARLGEPLALGYSSAGTVIEVGAHVEEFTAGDEVVCAGAGYACHAEVIFVPRNLCVRLPEELSFEEGAFGTLGAIAMHGVRQADVSLGKRVGVIGLGLVGQLVCQILRAAGCQVIGVDTDRSRVDVARELGVEEAVPRDEPTLRAKVTALTDGLGLDACIIAAATTSSDPIELAGELLGDRGRVVVVGAVGMDLPRRPYYDKELELRLSRSYGPGRYDPNYEEKGIDYPVGYVRWTERRNMASFVELVAEGKVDVKPLITHRFPIDRAIDAYRVVTGEAKEAAIAILLTYPKREEPIPARIVTRESRARAAAPVKGGCVGLGLVGAGTFVRSTILPALSKVAGAEFVGVATASGATAKHVAKRWKFHYCTGDYHELLADGDIQAVIIATPHNLHAEQVVEAMKADKDVFVEKPLALTREQLQSVIDVQAETGRRVMVGFNRRFSRAGTAASEFFRNARVTVIYRVNAGVLPAGHWLSDPQVGGGRLLGEVCHFIDFVRFLGGSPIVQICATALSPDSDSVRAVVGLANGSHGTILYTANGAANFSKERVEVFGGGRAAVIDDFRRFEFADGKRRSRTRYWRQDKGHRREMHLFVENVRGGKDVPIPFDEVVNTTLATLAAHESLRTGTCVDVQVEPTRP